MWCCRDKYTVVEKKEWDKDTSTMVESGCQQHSNSMMYDSDLRFICYAHELRRRSGRDFQEYISYISANCLLCSNQLFDYFLLDKSNMVNYVPKYKWWLVNGLNLMSSWRCGLWSSHTSPRHCKSLDKVVIFLLWVDYDLNSFRCKSALVVIVVVTLDSTIIY
jgi:hypothetical protein